MGEAIPIDDLVKIYEMYPDKFDVVTKDNVGSDEFNALMVIPLGVLSTYDGYVRFSSDRPSFISNSISISCLESSKFLMYKLDIPESLKPKEVVEWNGVKVNVLDVADNKACISKTEDGKRTLHLVDVSEVRRTDGSPILDLRRRIDMTNNPNISTEEELEI